MPNRSSTRSRRSAGVGALIGALLSATSARAETAGEAPFRAALARRYAPIHHQGVAKNGPHALSGAADYITRVDFDGDFDARNNWDNASDARFPLAAHAYFAVVETTTHWFITYLYFHPRDWSSTFLETEHENDSEGVLLTVARDGTRYGALRAAITVAHSNFYSYLPRRSPWSDGREDVDGTLSVRWFEGAFHPVTFAQAETHAIKAWPYYPDRGYKVIYYPSLTRSEVPSGPNDRHVLYQLHDLLEPGGLWARRQDPALFATDGSFAGDKSGGCGRGVLWCRKDAAHAPWAWDDHDDASPPGAWARDPAGLIRAYFNTHEEALAGTYTFNPFR